jgi:hypothetical protein
MKIHMEAVTLLSVLFATATATSSSVSAAAAATADEAQQEDRRRLKKASKKTKKSKQTNAPTSIEPTSNTLKLRIVLDNDATVIAAATVGGPPDFAISPSIIGSKAIATGSVFFRELVTIGEDGEVGPIAIDEGTPEVLYTQLCTITKGTFPSSIETNSCDFSLCFTAPLIGSCVFYKSGGNFPFTFGEGLPPATATKIGGTGVIGFDSGPAFFTVFSAGSTKVLDLDLTFPPPENLGRNVMLAKTVPGESNFNIDAFVPSSIQHTLDSHVFFALFIFSPLPYYRVLSI